ncbi:hypothetical protein DPMN_115177 [Dreissena polymorpha]|uniref:Uncharacterized protein n=1 Tax=Dreissena polymorpha TaxID=45954 RepID=A0A9D4KLH6_DREPO|nr:hypothetical protein DPMN_115177 [Dreissena polymorpha]
MNNEDDDAKMVMILISYSPVVPSRQAFRFWASLSNFPHVLPICLASASRSRR